MLGRVTNFGFFWFGIHGQLWKVQGSINQIVSLNLNQTIYTFFRFNRFLDLLLNNFFTSNIEGYNFFFKKIIYAFLLVKFFC